MLAAMLLNQKAWLVSPSISIPMGCHGAGNDYHLPSVSEWWTWKTLNVQLIIFLCTSCQIAHQQSSSLFFMTKTGSSWKWPYGNLKWTDYVHSLIQKLHFSSTTEFFFQQSFYWFTFPAAWPQYRSLNPGLYPPLIVPQSSTHFLLWLHCSVCAKCSRCHLQRGLSTVLIMANLAYPLKCVGWC